MKHYPELDGLRGAAVLVVMVAHGTSIYVSGAYGVDMFFTLSGFLITNILLAEVAATGNVCLGNFYARRMLRLIPALWLTVGGVAADLLIAGRFGAQQARESAYALTYTINWILALGYGCGPVLAHTWSLAIEEQFYLLWPLAVVGLQHLKLSGWRTAALLAAGATACLIYRNAAPYDVGRIYRGLDTHCDGLLLGAALAYARSDPAPAGKLLGGRIVQAVRPVAAAAALPAALAVLPAHSGWFDLFSVRVGYFATGVLTVIVIDRVISGRGGVCGRLLAAGWLRYTGRISYGLYLYHWPILMLLGSAGPLRGRPAARFVVCVTLSYITAHLSYVLVERRFLALKDRFRSGNAVREAAREAEGGPV